MHHAARATSSLTRPLPGGPGNAGHRKREARGRRDAFSFPGLRAVLALALTLVTAGCASFAGGESRSGWDVGGEGRETVSLRVSNQNFSDARVYALWNGERRRLGLVTGNSSQTFTMDWRPGATLRIEVDFVAGGSFVSEGISSWPGESWEFIIPARVRD